VCYIHAGFSKNLLYFGSIDPQIGGQESKAILLNESGRAMDFAMNAFSGYRDSISA